MAPNGCSTHRRCARAFQTSLTRSLRAARSEYTTALLACWRAVSLAAKRCVPWPAAAGSGGVHGGFAHRPTGQRVRSGRADTPPPGAVPCAHRGPYAAPAEPVRPSAKNTHCPAHGLAWEHCGPSHNGGSVPQRCRPGGNAWNMPAMPAPPRHSQPASAAAGSSASCPGRRAVPLTEIS